MEAEAGQMRPQPGPHPRSWAGGGGLSWSLCARVALLTPGFGPLASRTVRA